MAGLSFGVVSTFAPTQCGLANFSASMVGALAGVGVDSRVVRLVDATDAPQLPTPVSAHWVRGDRESARAAAETLNALDLAVIQHEFGIFGGPDGIDVLSLFSWLTVPAVVVLHTVLTHPSPNQRLIVEELGRRAATLVVMTGAARSRLLEHYSVDPGKVTLIPHGTTPPPMSGRSADGDTLLTWGLLGPGKGIEAVIDTLPVLAGMGLRPTYVVAGQTHPKVAERDGEAYRISLRQRARAAGVSDQLVFEDRYLDADTLGALVSRAAVVLLPYESREQVTSGVLVDAVGAGRPIVATAFPHAVELLSSGAGLTVPHGDVEALAHAVGRVLTDRELANNMAAMSDRLRPQLMWTAVAGRYLRLAHQLKRARLAAAA